MLRFLQWDHEVEPMRDEKEKLIAHLEGKSMQSLYWRKENEDLQLQRLQAGPQL